MSSQEQIELDDSPVHKSIRKISNRTGLSINFLRDNFDDASLLNAAERTKSRLISTLIAAAGVFYPARDAAKALLSDEKATSLSNEFSVFTLGTAVVALTWAAWRQRSNIVLKAELAQNTEQKAQAPEQSQP